VAARGKPSLQAGDSMAPAEQDKPYVLLPATSFLRTHSPLLTYRGDSSASLGSGKRHLAQAVMLRDVKRRTDLLILPPWPKSSPFQSLPLRRRAAQSFHDSDQESSDNDRIKPAKREAAFCEFALQGQLTGTYCASLIVRCMRSSEKEGLVDWMISASPSHRLRRRSERERSHL